MLSTDGSVVISQQRLAGLDGQVHALLSNDKPNLVYFFAPWCNVCALSIGNLAYLSADKINVVVVALDFESQNAVSDFVLKHNVTSRVLLGHNKLKTEFAIQGYPSYYLIDNNHTVVSRSYGYSTALGLKLRASFGVE